MYNSLLQLTKKEHNISSRHISVSFGYSTSGTGSIQVSQRSNSFNTGIGFATNPVEAPELVNEFGMTARMIANDFAKAIHEL